MAGVTDGNGKCTEVEENNKDLSIIRTAYQNKKSDGQLKIVAGEIIEKPFKYFLEWIK